MTEHEHHASVQLSEVLHRRLERIERLLEPEKPERPAWRSVTLGEQRWAVSVAILVAVGLQLALPTRLTIRTPPNGSSSGWSPCWAGRFTALRLPADPGGRPGRPYPSARSRLNAALISER
ncbi:hypothetical protein ACIG0C_24125 [Kitasatospora aureofaciens]|uniref:hypothetical protein n=1 Tax=Kitasatospora aureofaciens TaxID=1894 RepID=UPI0007E2487C|nr:hypothetical protein [Kitasatospora aureofaciens]